jgi:hypothetical protein
MRPWKYLLVAVLINLCLLLAVGALFWSKGAFARPPSPPDNPSAPASENRSVPAMMNYQGLLLDDQGNPVEGTHDLTFNLYFYMVSGGTEPPFECDWFHVYSETHTVDLDRGLFNVVLGETEPLPPWWFTGPWESPQCQQGAQGDLEIGVQVDGGEELSPRTPLLTSPFAFRSEYTNNLPEYDYRERYSPPDATTSVSLTHSLGGTLETYIVDLWCEKDGLAGPYQCAFDEAHWGNLTDASIEISYQDPASGGPDHIIVRIWVGK